MNVLYDHQIFSSQNFGGISRYFFELLRGQADQAELSLIYSDNEYLTSDPKFRSRIAPKASVTRPPPWVRVFNRAATRRAALVERANREQSLSLLQAGAWQVFHPTYYDPYFLDCVGAKPFVLTVYDMIHELFPEHFRLDDSAPIHKKLLVHRAAHIIAISETTKRDLVAVYGVPESRVSVIYLGGSLDAAVVGEAHPPLPQRYVLMVGTRVGYKNCYFALRALSRLSLEQRDLSFVFTGGGSFTREEVAFFASLGLAGRVHYFPAGDAQLATLYRHAEAFVFPSLYEGFGIPVVEAFSCGCPVIASNTPALKEVAGDAAEFFDPKDPNSICDAVTRVIGDSSRRAELKEKGKSRLARYSWSECVAKTIDVYRSVLR